MLEARALEGFSTSRMFVLPVNFPEHFSLSFAANRPLGDGCRTNPSPAVLTGCRVNRNGEAQQGHKGTFAKRFSQTNRRV